MLQLLGYPLFHKCAHSSCFSWLSFISVIFQSHLGASWLPSCTKILLTVRTRPAAIALNYSVKNIQNNIWQKIIIFYEKSRFNSIVWGEHEQAPNRLDIPMKQHTWHRPAARIFRRGVIFSTQSVHVCASACKSKGVWGHAPPENLLHLDALRSHLRPFWGKVRKGYRGLVRCKVRRNSATSKVWECI